METLIISDLKDLKIAAQIIKEGGLVASPTETVYGLCANALDPLAVEGIFVAKGRPSDNPLIIHIADRAVLSDLADPISHEATLLMDAFWPGPLTLIFKATNLVPKVVTGGLDTVAIRFPSHPVMQKLIKLCGLPLAAPSANISGKPSPTNVKRVIEDLSGKIHAIIDGSDSEFGVESTVIDMTSTIPTILRPGGITHEMLEEVLGTVLIDPAIHSSNQALSPKAPGMKYAHYTPNAQVFIVRGNMDNVVNKINELTQKHKQFSQKTGILATDETLHLFDADLVLSVGTNHDLSTVAAQLFETLRSFDDKGIDIIYSLAFDRIGIGDAIMNRLEKSAAYQIIDV